MGLLSVLIPTYNEARNLPDLIRRIMRTLSPLDFEVVFIDDNSPDGTADIAEEAAETYANIKVLRRPRKMSLSSAVLDGLEMCHGGIITVMDADLQHQPELIPEMLTMIGKGCELVIASRYMEGGRIEGFSFSRRLVSKVATLLAHVLLPKTRGIKDPLSGFFMLRNSVIDRVELKPTGYKMLLEILVKGRCNSVLEVPYTFRPRRAGKSKLGLRDAISYVIHIMNLRCDSDVEGEKLHQLGQDVGLG